MSTDRTRHGTARPTARMSRTAAAGLALTIVAVLVFGTASAAQAVIWPNGFNPKQYMLNVLGSMLSGASPDSKLGGKKRAVIQADQKFDHSWEGLNEQWKKSATNVPNTYEDYVLQRQQYFQDKGIKGVQGQKGTENNTGKGTKYVKPMKAPSTKAKQFAKAGVGLGVGIGSSVAWYYRSDIGSGVGGLLGMDTTSAYCQDRDSLGNMQKATDFITGIDCDAWAMDRAYDPNLDAVARPGGFANYPVGWSCTNPADNTTCYQVFTYKPSPTSAKGEQKITVEAQRKGNAQGDVYTTYWCKPPTGPIQGKFTGLPGDFNASNGWSRVTTLDCGDGQLYALELGTGNYSGTDPEKRWTDPFDKRFMWLGDLSPNYIKPQSANPDRTFLCTYTNADGTTSQKETDTFKETDSDVPSPICPAADPKADKPVTGVTVDEVNKADGSKQRIYGDTTTPEFQKWWGAYPECREGACALDLISNQKKASCFDSTAMNDVCMDWMRDPDKTANYQCMYGGHKVDLSECYVYGDTFNPEKVLNGTAYSDPATGETVDGQSSPNAAQKTLGRTIVDPRDFSGCLDRGWGKVNPVEWVMTPVTCSLQWAFAPSQQAIIAEGNKVENAWAGKAPGAMAGAAAGWHFTPAASGCKYTEVLNLGSIGGTSQKQELGINACSGPMATFAAWVKGTVTVVLVILTLLTLRRIAAGFVNAEGTTRS